MRLASQVGPGRLPIKRDPSNRPFAKQEDIYSWWESHQFVYGKCKSVTKRTYQSVVYFIRDGDFIKIGFSAVSALERLGTLQTGNPRELVFLGQIIGTKALESELHCRFSRLRVRGEWFRAESELSEFLSGLSFI